MANYIQLPNGAYFPALEGEDYQTTVRAAYAKYPEAFGGEKTLEEGPKSGFMPALKAGFSNLKGDVAALAGRTGLMALPEAEKYIAEQEAYQKKTFAPTTAGWTEDPLTKIKELAGGSLPYMAAPLVAGGALAAGTALAPEAMVAAGLAEALPVAAGAAARYGLSSLGSAAATGLAGATSAGQFTGSNLSRQMQEGKKLGETDLGAAALASIPQAALDTVSMKMIPGLGKMFERVGVDLSEKAAKDLAKEGIKKTAADYLLTTGKTMGIEGLTEAGQQVFERMQAGLSITDPSARAEYFDNFLGGAVLGGILAPAGRYVERGQEQARFDKGAREKQAADRIAATQASEQATAAEEAKKQTPEYALQAQADYLAAEQRKEELKAQLHPTGKGRSLTADQKQDNKEIKKALSEHEELLNAANLEYRKYRQFLPAEPAPAPAKIENTTQLQQPEMFGAPAAPKAPELDMFGKPVERVAPEAAAEPQVDYNQQVRMLEQLLEQYGTQAKGASLQDKIALGTKAEQASKALEEARVAAGAMPKAVETQIAALNKKMGVAETNGDVPLQKKLAQQILNLQNPQQSIELQPFKGTSQTAEQIEQEKASALEAQRQKAQQDAKAESDAYVAQRIQERRTQRKLNEANAPATEQPQRDEELRHRAEKETIDKLVATLPTGSTVTPGQIMLGLGGEKAHLRDLQTQLAIAKLTRNKALINSLNDQIADIKASQENAATNKPVERLPALGEGKLPESRAKEAEAEQHADRQSELLQAFVAQLQKLKLRPDTAKVAARLQDINKKREAAGKPAITLADQSSTLLDTARMAYLKSHLDEIESRRAAFGLPPMADWEIGEARARVMEGFNELQDRWGQAVPENAPAGKRQFGAPTAAVAALQDQMRTNIYQNVSSAAERMMKNTEGTMKEKTAQRSATPTFERDENGQLRQTGYARQTGPQPITPNLNLREQPKLAEDDKQNTLDMIDQVLNTLETRTTAKPTETVKPPAKVKSLSDIAQLLAEEKSGTTTAKTDEASVELLHQLRDALEKTSDKEFITLAREQVQRVMEGNLPDQFAVRELGDMIRVQEEGRQSTTRPGATQEELQRTSAQPQRSLFPEGEPVTQRATPENFQKMLDSKNVQGMREALAQQKTDNQAALQAVKDSLQPAKTAAQQAEAALNKAKQKAAPLLASAEKERGEPEWYAPAARKVVELETALQSIPPRIALLTDIREKIANLDADQKNTLIRQVKQTLAIADKKPFERSQELLKLQEKYKKAKYYSTNPNPRLIKNISENLALVKENIDTTYSPKEITELLELQNALTDSSLLSKEINRLTAAVRLAKRTVDQARADLNKLVEQHVADTTVRESLLAEADKATAKIEKLTKAFEETKRQETATQTKPAEEKPVSEATPMATWRAALQRGREGMDLPGTRVTQDVSELKQRILGIRRKLGSFDAQLETLQDPKNKLTAAGKEKIAELKQKRQAAAVELETVYENAPRITTEIKEQGQLDLEKAFDEAQAAGYDLIARKKQEKAGEIPATLAAPRSGNAVVDVRTGRVSESGERKRPSDRAKAAQEALSELAEARAELKALQDRMQYLRDNDKAKKGNRYTPLFKELQAKEAALKETVAEKQAVVAEVTKSQKETNAAVASARKSVEEAQSGKDALALKEAEEQRQAEASGDILLSRGTPTNASTVESITAELAEAGIVLPKEKTHTDKKPAKLMVFASVDDFTKAYPTTKGKVPSDAKGLVHKGQAFLFANNIGKGEALGVALHEVGAHIGFRNFFNPAQYKAIATTVKNWAKRNDGSIESKIGKAALARVETAETPADQVDDEVIAYAVEEAVKAGIQPAGAAKRSAAHNWLKMVVDAFKKALAAFGINPSGLKAGDLVNFAYGCAQLELRGTWHGSDAKFTAFDTAFAGEGEGAFDRRFEREKSLGVGPYVTGDKDYAEYYQTAVTFGKASNVTGYGDMSYQQFRELDNKYMSISTNNLSPEELRIRYESNLLTRYLRGVQEGDSLNPKENKAAAEYIAETKERLKKEIANTNKRIDVYYTGPISKLTGLATKVEPRGKDASAVLMLSANLYNSQRRLDAVNTLDVSKIKGLKERPKEGNLYRTLDDVPDERVYQINSDFTVGERPKLDALLQKYGDQYAKQQAEQTGTYPANGLFFDMRDKLGVDEATRVLKAAGIDAIEQNNEGGLYVERAFIGVKPEIMGTNLRPIGPAKGPLFSRADYKSEDALSKFAERVVATPKTLRERAGSHLALQFEMATANMRAGAITALENGTKDPNTMGSTREFCQAIFSITAADQAGSITSMSLNEGPPVMFKDAKGYYEVRSSKKNDAGAMFDAVQDIPDSYGNTEAKMGLSQAYMVAQRAMSKGLKKLDLGALGVTEQELTDVMSAVNADPKLKAALENVRTKYNAYNRGMIEWLSSPQVGAISQADAKAYLKDEDYVPYYRVRADGVAELVFGNEKTLTIGDIAHQPYLAELKGGETKLMPLDKSIMRNTMLLVTKGMSNMAMKNVAYAMQAAGQGLGPVDKNGKPTNLMPIHAGKGPADASVIRWTQEPDPNRPDDKGERWLRVQTNDTIFGGIPAELIIKSLEGAHLTLPAFLKWGGVAGDLLRSGVTRTPIYLAKQLFRDPFAATATSGLDYGPLSAIFKANREFLKIATGKSEAGAKMIEKGLIQSGMFEGDPANMSKIALQLASGKSQGVFDKLFSKADKLALQADAATRALIYENAIKNGLSEVEASHAVRESMNFSKRGLSPTVQYASRMIPFFNAQIQGLSVLFKAATGNMPANDVLKIKRKFFNNAMMLTGFGIAYAMAMDDDDYYKNAKPKDRYSNFFVPLPGVDEPLKLPIPYEFGFFFSAGVAAVDAIKGEVDTPQQLRALKDMFVGAIPGASNDFVVPQIIKPLAEVYANKSFYSGNPLVSARLEKLDPEAQYNANTTEFAKFMAKMVPGLSPIQIEHIVSGYLGQIPLMIAATTNDLFRDGKAEPTRKMSDLPLIGSSFQRKYGGEDADVVYKLANDAAAAKRTFDNYRKTGKIEDAKEYLQEHRAEITVAPMALQYQKLMGALRTQEEIIRGSNMPPDAKAKRIDDLDKQRQLQSERYLKAIRRAEEASGRT
jgi:hypothetical protein